MGSKKVVEQSWSEQSENIFAFSSYIHLSSLVKWLYAWFVCISICIFNCIFISNVFVFVCCHICLVWPTGCPRSSSPAEPPASCLLGQEGRQGKAGGRQTLFFFWQYNNTSHNLYLVSYITISCRHWSSHNTTTPHTHSSCTSRVVLQYFTRERDEVG